MPAATIVRGIWRRNVPWKQRSEWRADIFKSVLWNSDLRECCFVLKGGPTVTIPADELRRIIAGGRDHYHGKIWGPFNINPAQSTVDGHKVQMKVD